MVIIMPVGDNASINCFCYRWKVQLKELMKEEVVVVVVVSAPIS